MENQDYVISELDILLVLLLILLLYVLPMYLCYRHGVRTGESRAYKRILSNKES
jgi:hypothetical protein